MRFSTILILLPLLLGFTACGPDPDRPLTAESETKAIADPDALPTEPDQIEHTRNANPQALTDQTIPDENSVTPVVKENPTPAPKPATPLAAPNKTVAATDGTTTAKPVAAELPTPAAQGGTESTQNRPAQSQQENATMEAAPDHQPWNALLQQFVTDAGDVDYAGFKQSESALDAYLAELRKGTPTNDWSREEAMAYWINAYNAFTVKRILNDYPVNSIQDLDGGDPWKVKWIELGGETYSLNNIEHDILRPKYKDARIHFAVNCAAASCPPLPNEAFTADKLDRMLQNNTRAFIRNPDYNRIAGGGVKVSKIFDWYGEDFGDLRTYLNEYLATPIAEGTDIGYADYDWSLNKQ